MKDIVILEEYVHANLNDRIAARVLVDMHEELLELPHRIALRAVAAMRVKWRRERDLKRAAVLLSADYIGRGEIVAFVLQRARPRRGRFALVELQAGYRPPWGDQGTCTRAGFGHDPYPVYVGARYVLAVEQFLFGTHEGQNRVARIVAPERFAPTLHTGPKRKK